MSIVPGSYYPRVLNPFIMDVWDPYHEFNQGITFPPASSSQGALETRVEWRETPEVHVYTVSLPGYNPSDVKVRVDGKMLYITGEKRVEKEEKDERGYYRVVRSGGSFTQGFGLPDDAKVDRIRSFMENGTLTVTVPRAEKAKGTKRFVQIH